MQDKQAKIIITKEFILEFSRACDNQLSIKELQALINFLEKNLSIRKAYPQLFEFNNYNLN